MSRTPPDLKYEHINFALSEWGRSKRTENNALVLDVVREVLSGEVPVVDMTGVVQKCEQDWGRASEMATRFSDSFERKEVDIPLRKWLLYAGWTAENGVNWGFVKVGCEGDETLYTTYLFLYSVKSSSGATKIMDGTQGVESAMGYDALYSSLTCARMCMWMWMTLRNAVSVDETAQRAERRRHKALASVRFRRVFIQPIRKRGHVERYEITGGQCPLHHVRGHLRVYTESAPLFGRYVGAVWVPEHSRGDEKNGRIVQEYVVEPPQE